MEVKPDYKQTDIGVIPDDWDVKPLSSIFKIVRGGSPRPAGAPKYFNGDFIPWLTVAALTNIPDTKIHVTETASCLTEEGSKHSRTLEKTTLIIANSGATLGVAKILGLKCCANDGIAALLYPQEGDIYYICHFINSITKYLRVVVATGNGQPNLNTGLIGNIQIPLPTLAQQRSIASALSDTDALINGLDALIAKKQGIKQATMQQLLTGTVRLPGFVGAWKTFTYGKLFQFLSTANSPRSDLSDFGDVGYVHYGDIHTQDDAFFNCDKVTVPYISQAKVSSLSLVQNGDLIMADASEDYAGVGKSVEVKNIAGRKVVAGLHTFLLRGNRELLADGYRGYLQFLPSVKTAMTRFATGISVYGISKTNVSSIEVALPKPDEQSAIAAVLSDMDAELAALTQRRDKTRALKQGIMQELLTGKTRLA